MEEVKKVFEESSEPNENFVKNLKMQVVSQYAADTTPSKLLNILPMKSQWSLTRISSVVAIVAFGLLAAVVDYKVVMPKQATSQLEVLNQISNSYVLSKNSTPNKTTSVVNRENGVSADSMMIRYPTENRDYNYKKVTNVYTIGASANKCTQMLPFQGEITKDEFTQFFTSKSEYIPSYSKSITFIGDNVYYYNLKNNSDEWQYQGGSYAVHLTNVQSILPLLERTPVDTTIQSTEGKSVDSVSPDTTTSTTVTPTNAVTNYFGPDAKVIGTETINGVEVYKVMWSYQVACSDIKSNPNGTVSNDGDTKVVSVVYAKKKTYEIIGESLYLNSVSTNNLLYTRMATEITKTVASFDAVKSEFTFEYNVPVKNVDASAYQYDKEYRKAVLAYVGKHLDTVTYVTSKNLLQSLSSTYVTIVPEDQKHLIDRDFYSQNDYGTKQYENSKGMFTPYTEAGKTYPTMQLSYTNAAASEWFSLSEFEASVVGVHAVEAMGVDATQIAEFGKTNVTVNGKIVVATVWQVKEFTSPGSAGSSTGSIPEEVEPPTDVTTMDKNLYVVFTIDGVTSVVQRNASAKTAVADVMKGITLGTVSTNNAEALEKALTVDVSQVSPVIMY